jgi:hypothetical protein
MTLTLDIKEYPMVTNSMAFLKDDDEEARKAMQRMENAMNAEHKRAVARSLREGQMRIFRMPSIARDNGTRVATLRFLSSFVQVRLFLEHGKWQGFRLVCPEEFGMSCEWCNKLYKKFDIDRETLLEDVSVYDSKMRDAKGTKLFDTKEINAWPIYYYEGNDGDGEVQIFGYPINGNSPVPGILSLYKNRYVNAPEDQRLDVTEYDIELTQHGESKKRTFTPIDTVRGKFAYPERLEGLDLSKDAMLFGYALGLPNQDEKWLAQLQEKRKELEAQAPKPIRVSKEKAQKLNPNETTKLTLADTLNLEFEEQQA